MRRNFILLVDLATLAIFLMVAPSHTAASFPQITSSELTGPYCNATNIIEAFLHDVIPLQSCAPTELTRDTIYCKVTTISENGKNMSCASKSSLRNSRVAIFMDRLIRLTALVFLFAMWAFTYRFIRVLCQWAQWIRDIPENKSFGSIMLLPLLWKFRKASPQEHLLKEKGIISYRYVSPDTSLNTYLLKEAFEELERHPRILENPNFYDFITAFLLDPVPRAAFMKIPEDRKFDWLNKRYCDDIKIGSVWRKVFKEIV